MLIRFKEHYYKNIFEDLKLEFKYQNKYQVPCLEKIVINMGVGKSVSDSKLIDNAVNDLMLISGQKPIITIAKKSIATFKLRSGMKIGCKVTLRKDRMYDFLERLVIIALPRVKEFRGFSKNSLDGNGNLSFGIKEHIVFPEINYDKVDIARGMDITIVTTANTNLEGFFLLSKFNLPFYN